MSSRKWKHLRTTIENWQFSLLSVWREWSRCGRWTWNSVFPCGDIVTLWTYPYTWGCDTVIYNHRANVNVIMTLWWPWWRCDSFGRNLIAKVAKANGFGSWLKQDEVMRCYSRRWWIPINKVMICNMMKWRLTWFGFF